MIRSQVLYPAELRARTRGKSSYCKGNPASTAFGKNPISIPKMPVVCTGFAVRADFHYEKFLVLLVIKGGQVIRAHPEALRNFPDRGLPLPHLPDRLRAEYDIYCLLDMDNSSGGRR